MSKSLPLDLLRSCIEPFGHGEFQTLFDYEWTRLDDFLRSANDFVAKRYRARFRALVVKALAEAEAKAST